MARRVGIWRDRWLPASETFIRLHVEALDAWQPVCIGLSRVESGQARESDHIVYEATPKWLRTLESFVHRWTGLSLRLYHKLRSAELDVLHAHFAWDAFLLVLNARALGLPVVVTVHGYDVTVLPSLPGLRGLAYRARIRLALQLAARVVAVSEPIRRSALNLGAQPSKTIVVHNGVVVNNTLQVVQERLGLLFVGRLVEKKGLSHVLAALTRAPEPYRSTRLIVCGDGPLRQQLEDYASAHQLHVDFLGQVDNSVVQKLLDEVQAICVPSFTARNGDMEGLPTIILEAAAHSVPTIGYAHSGIPEAVIDGYTGLLCDEQDVTELSRLIRLVTDDPDLLATLGARARERAESEFDVRHQVKQLEQIYEEVAKK